MNEKLDMCYRDEWEYEKFGLYLYDFAFEEFTYHMTLATVHQGYAYLVSHDVQIVWVRDAGSSAAVTSQVHSIGCREPHREIMMPNRNWH